MRIGKIGVGVVAPLAAAPSSDVDEAMGVTLGSGQRSDSAVAVAGIGGVCVATETVGLRVAELVGDGSCVTASIVTPPDCAEGEQASASVATATAMSIACFGQR